MAGARAPWASSRAACACLVLAQETPLSEGEALTHGLLCMQLWETLCCAVPGAETSLAAALTANAASTALPSAAGVLAAAGALSGLAQRLSALPAADAPACAALRQCVRRAAEEGSSGTPRSLLAAHAVALAVARCPATLAPADAGNAVTRCVSLATMEPIQGAALAPLRTLLDAARRGAPPAHASAALAVTLRSPMVEHAGALVRLLCSSAAASGEPAVRRELLDCACALAAASYDATRALERAAPPGWLSSLEAGALQSALHLPFLCVAAFLATSWPAYLGPAAAPDAGADGDAAGRMLDALARVDCARTQHAAAPPPGYAQLLEAAVRELGARQRAVEALLRGLPQPSELQGAAAAAAPQAHPYDAPLLARTHFLLRALPFALPLLERGGAAGDEAILGQVAPLALACALAPACRGAVAASAHALMRALLAGGTLTGQPGRDRGVLAEEYALGTLGAFPGVPLDQLAGAAAAALPALPPQRQLALLQALCGRAELLDSSAGAAREAAPGVRTVLFRTLAAVHHSQLERAIALVEGCVRRLRGVATRQAAIDQLCAVCADTDDFRKRTCVDWVLHLATTL